ncbi:class F sortase [Sphaerisporangium aureirubrum]|uniref:Class F sortase n=1 Tax=Sphaerisporangium aureirubrum TaxID=1544736 RepID=A0ABW1NAD4_9ACTN
MLLALGSLAGVGLVMAGLLMYLAPAPHPGDPAAAPGASPGASVSLDGAASGDGARGAAAVDDDPVSVVTRTVGPGGEGAPQVEVTATAGPPDPAAPPATTLRMSAPTRVKIPRIGVDAPLTSVGVRKSGEIEVPPLDRPKLAGWYRLGPSPGEAGPAVILGHVNTRRGPAVFGRLRELSRGDKITVTRADGSTAVFTVDGAEQASKARFPTKRVYGHVDHAALRLITCGGIFNPRSHSYTDNIIVYATLSSRA